MNLWFATGLSITLIGCVSVSSAISVDYSGPTATIEDTIKRRGPATANMFYLSHIDGRIIDSAMRATSLASESQGSKLVTKHVSRVISTQKATLHIVAENINTAAIIPLFRSEKKLKVEGDVVFTPVASVSYKVAGTLSEQYSGVWIEDAEGNIVSSKVEILSDAYSFNLKQAQKYSDTHASLEGSAREHFFIKIQPGDEVGLIIAKLGEPDAISTQRPSRGANEALVTYDYQGLGKVRLNGSAANNGKVSWIYTPQLAEDDLQSIRREMTVTDGELLRHVAERHSRHGHIQADVLDLFAQKIWDNRVTKDKYIVDAMSHMCKLVGASGNGRYVDALRALSEQARSGKLRKYARKALGLLASEDVPQFVPI